MMNFLTNWTTFTCDLDLQALHTYEHPPTGNGSLILYQCMDQIYFKPSYDHWKQDVLKNYDIHGRNHADFVNKKAKILSLRAFYTPMLWTMSILIFSLCYQITMNIEPFSKFPTILISASLTYVLNKLLTQGMMLLFASFNPSLQTTLLLKAAAWNDRKAMNGVLALISNNDIADGNGFYLNDYALLHGNDLTESDTKKDPDYREANEHIHFYINQLKHLKANLKKSANKEAHLISVKKIDFWLAFLIFHQKKEMSIQCLYYNQLEMLEDALRANPKRPSSSWKILLNHDARCQQLLNQFVQVSIDHEYSQCKLYLTQLLVDQINQQEITSLFLNIDDACLNANRDVNLDQLVLMINLLTEHPGIKDKLLMVWSTSNRINYFIYACMYSLSMSQGQLNWEHYATLLQHKHILLEEVLKKHPHHSIDMITQEPVFEPYDTIENTPFAISVSMFKKNKDQCAHPSLTHASRYDLKPGSQKKLDAFRQSLKSTCKQYAEKLNPEIN